jgi:hypothetical protein
MNSDIATLTEVLCLLTVRKNGATLNFIIAIAISLRHLKEKKLRHLAVVTTFSVNSATLSGKCDNLASLHI